MNPIKKLLLLVFFTVSVHNLYSQAARKQLFEVVTLPRKARYDRQKLNREIANALTIKDVIKIINTKPALHNIPILLRTINKAGENLWWPVNSPDSKNEPIKWIVQQSNINTSYKQSNVNDLETDLSDTTFVIDSFHVSFFFNSKNLNKNGFYFNGQCSQSMVIHKIKVISSNDDYFYFKGNISICANSSFNAALFNTSTDDKILKRVVFVFADDDALETLTQMVQYLLRNDKKRKTKEVTAFLMPYIQLHYGNISFINLTSWVKSIALDLK